MTIDSIATEEIARAHEADASALPEGRLILGTREPREASGGIYQHTDPSTGRVLTTVPIAGTAEVDEALIAAQAAFPAWKATPPAERARLLNALADAIDADAHRLGIISSLEIGNPSKFVEFSMAPTAARWYRYYAGWADKTTGDTFQTHASENFTYSVPEPLGVVAAIPGWNFAFLSLSWKLAPALAAGNVLVLKTTEYTAFSALRLIELAQQVGFPAGVLNLVVGGKEPAQALVTDPRVAKLTFTGGPGTAKSILGGLATNLTPGVFELGGKSACLVFADADLDAAVPATVGFAMSNTGQVCASPSRVLVEDSIYDAYVERATAFLENLPIGDPLNPATYIGPIGHAAHYDKVRGDIAQAVQADAGRLLYGGDDAGDDAGYFVQPAIFGDVDPASALATEEVFGPVLALFRFTDEERAVDIANALPYGLSAYAWTNDLRRGIRLGDALRAGAVNINTIQATEPAVPFGGVGLSGYGKEGGRVGIDEFLHYKTVSIAR